MYDYDNKNNNTESDPSPLAMIIAINYVADNNDSSFPQDFELCESNLETGGFGRGR